MKKIFLISVFAALTLGAFAQQWEPLFNGRNLKGWKLLNGKAPFKVEDGMLIGVSRMGEPNTFLATTGTYGDFILEFEFMADDGLNSGVQFRSRSSKDYDNGRVYGYQYEIDTAPRGWTAGIYDEATPRLWVYPLTFNQPARTAYKPGEWNTGRIEAIGTSIRTWLNGIECADMIDDAILDGFIALQVHAIGDPADEGKTIRWRNIRICTNEPALHSTPANSTVPQINCIPNTISEREAAEGWRLLWDGETTEGWRGARLDGFPSNGWSISDGVLTVEKSDGGGDPRTEETSSRSRSTVISSLKWIL